MTSGSSSVIPVYSSRFSRRSSEDSSGEAIEPSADPLAEREEYTGTSLTGNGGSSSGTVYHPHPPSFSHGVANAKKGFARINAIVNPFEHRPQSVRRFVFWVEPKRTIRTLNFQSSQGWFGLIAREDGDDGEVDSGPYRKYSRVIREKEVNRCGSFLDKGFADQVGAQIFREGGSIKNLLNPIGLNRRAKAEFERAAPRVSDQITTKPCGSILKYRQETKLHCRGHCNIVHCVHPCC